MIYHYLLTRFNLALWIEDKNGAAIDREEWLKRRMALFETFCLPSVKNQSCQNFSWILLVDANTPAVYRERIKTYRKLCSQIKFVGVKAEYSYQFADIFRQVVMQDLKQKGWNDGDLCLTTYLDNDDSIANNFMERVQSECLSFHLNPYEKCFLSFDYGLQTYTKFGHFSTRIYYPNNHFLTLAEYLLSSDSSLSSLRTCYGYGSHFLLEKRRLVKVHHIKENMHPMWIEIIHEENVDNDVKMTLDTHIVYDKDMLRRVFSLDMDIESHHLFAFILRVLKQMWRRSKNKF